MKTYYWLDRNRFLSHVRYASAGAFMTAVALALFATLAAPSAYAEDHQFTIAYQITGIQLGVPDSEHVTFTVLGTGHSPLLRNFTATGTVVTPLPQHACDDIYADVTITTANGAAGCNAGVPPCNFATRVSNFDPGIGLRYQF